MPSLRDFRDRISSVKSTKKITSAMKMVAASKLRRAQKQAEASQPYAQTMADIIARVAQNVVVSEESSKLLIGTGSEQRQLLIVVSADRGLCGGFNGNLSKAVRKLVYDLIGEGKTVSIICVGRKIREALRSDLGTHIWKTYEGVTSKKRVEFIDAQNIMDYVLTQFENDEFDVCTLIYNEFQSILSQKPKAHQLIPFRITDKVAEEEEQKEEGDDSSVSVSAQYDFEPSEEEILNALLPRNLNVQLYRALLDSAAGEQASRMTAMDNATRNAGEMIDMLTLEYNRARQAYITKELIEIISGAEAL